MKSNGSPSHEEMLRKVAKHVRQRFYRDVRARLGGYRPPPAFRLEDRDRVPDVTMSGKHNRLHILEVETPDSIPAPETRAKWVTFSRQAARNRGKFWVVVPKGTGEEARLLARDLSIEATVWEI